MKIVNEKTTKPKDEKIMTTLRKILWTKSCWHCVEGEGESGQWIQVSQSEVPVQQRAMCRGSTKANNRVGPSNQKPGIPLVT